MTNHDFITIPAGDNTQMDAYIAMPDGKGPFPAVIVLQEAFGVNSHIRSIAERLCKEGYAAIAPELFHRVGKRIDLPYDDFDQVRPVIQQMTREGFTIDVTCCHTWLQQQANVIHDKIGTVGFCMGGRVSFIANLSLPLAAAVSFYGSGIDQLVAEAGALHAHHLFIWGGLDKHISQDVINKVTDGMKAAGKDYTNIVISDADHGFNCDKKAVYNPKAAKAAWAHTVAFFDAWLKD